MHELSPDELTIRNALGLDIRLNRDMWADQAIVDWEEPLQVGMSGAVWTAKQGLDGDQGPMSWFKHEPGAEERLCAAPLVLAQSAFSLATGCLRHHDE